MGLRLRILFPILAAVALNAFPAARAQGTSGTYGNLTVTGTAVVNILNVTGSVTGTTAVNILNVLGDYADFGSWTGTSNTPGATFTYSDGTGGTNASITDALTRPASAWIWQRSGASWDAMELTSSNQLVLTGTQTSNPGSIVIDPAAGRITVNGNQVLTNADSAGSMAGGAISWDSSGDFTANGSASFANGSDLINSQTADGTLENADLNGTAQSALGGGYAGFLRIQSGAGPGDTAFEAYADDTQGAAGVQAYNRDTGQSFTFRSVATNYTWLTNTDWGGITQTMTLDNDGNLGIGTSTPQATLDVNGSGNFSGPVELAPQGDLPMGQFQSPPPDSGGGGGDGDDDAVFGGGGFGRGGNGAPATTGTGPGD